jgi:hypothetical protein
MDAMAPSVDSKTAELLRDDFTGTIWFAAAVIGSALPLTGLLATGWRPADLPQAAQTVWWIGAAVLVVALFGFAYAGCPVLGFPLPKEHRLKNVAIQGGVILFGVGSIMTMLAVLLSPA